MVDGKSAESGPTATVSGTQTKEITIVIVDHHLDLALALSDRTVVLERGQVTHIGPSRALSQDLALRRQVLWL